MRFTGPQSFMENHVFAQLLRLEKSLRPDVDALFQLKMLANSILSLHYYLTTT